MAETDKAAPVESDVVPCVSDPDKEESGLWPMLKLPPDRYDYRSRHERIQDAVVAAIVAGAVRETGFARGSPQLDRYLSDLADESKTIGKESGSLAGHRKRESKEEKSTPKSESETVTPPSVSGVQVEWKQEAVRMGFPDSRVLRATYRREMMIRDSYLGDKTETSIMRHAQSRRTASDESGLTCEESDLTSMAAAVLDEYYTSFKENMTLFKVVQKNRDMHLGMMTSALRKCLQPIVKSTTLVSAPLIPSAVPLS